MRLHSRSLLGSDKFENRRPQAKSSSLRSVSWVLHDSNKEYPLGRIKTLVTVQWVLKRNIDHMCNRMCVWGLLAFALILTSGCGGVEADYEKLGLVEISGTVTLDGTPVEGAVVMFFSPEETFCYGTTDSSGYYTLKLNSEKTGVIPGDKVVRISTTASTGEEEGGGGEEGDEEDPDAKIASKEERIPECYNKKTGLKVTVTESDSSFNFDLKSDCSVTGRS